jgi:hypothetical protein
MRRWRPGTKYASCPRPWRGRSVWEQASRRPIDAIDAMGGRLSEVSCRIDLPSVHGAESSGPAAQDDVRDAGSVGRCQDEVAHTVRGWLRAEGRRPCGGNVTPFSASVRVLYADTALLTYIDRQVRTIESLNTEIADADRELAATAKADPIAPADDGARCRTVDVGPARRRARTRTAEGQVEYGDAPMVWHAKTGRHRRMRLFVLRLGYSRRSTRVPVRLSSAQRRDSTSGSTFANHRCCLALAPVIDSRGPVLHPGVNRFKRVTSLRNEPFLIGTLPSTRGPTRISTNGSTRSADAAPRQSMAKQ